MVPLIAIGPSWAVWPSLADISAVLMVPIVLLDWRFQPYSSRQNRNLWRLAAFITIGCAASYAAFMSGLFGTAEIGKGWAFGVFQVLRIMEFLLVCLVSTNVELNESRLHRLRRLTLWVFLGIACGVLLTFTGIVPTRLVASHLPSALNTAGPWSSYSTGDLAQGVGFIGYNHGYTAVQLLLAAALCLHFGPRKMSTRFSVVGLLLVTTLLTGSRAGFLCAIVWVVAMEAKKPTALILGLAAASLLAVTLMNIDEDALSKALERQTSSTDSYEQDGFSGRTEIWQDRVSFLSAEPHRWLIGGGFGSAVESGNNAHMLYLQLILEVGIVGLGAFLIYELMVLKYLFRYEGHGRPLFWLTIVLLLSSFSQETLYPVAAFSHLLGFYVCIVAIGCRARPAMQSAPGSLVFQQTLIHARALVLSPTSGN